MGLASARSVGLGGDELSVFDARRQVNNPHGARASIRIRCCGAVLVEMVGVSVGVGVGVGVDLLLVAGGEQREVAQRRGVPLYLARPAILDIEVSDEWSGCDRHKHKAPQGINHLSNRNLIFFVPFHPQSPNDAQAHCHRHRPSPPLTRLHAPAPEGGSLCIAPHRTKRPGAAIRAQQRRPFAGRPNISQMIALPTKAPPQA